MRITVMCFSDKYSKTKMSWTSSDSDFEKVSSQKVSETHDHVPDDNDYNIKITGKSAAKFTFTLKKGKELPYQNTVVTKKGKGTFT